MSTDVSTTIWGALPGSGRQDVAIASALRRCPSGPAGAGAISLRSIPASVLRSHPRHLLTNVATAQGARLFLDVAGHDQPGRGGGEGAEAQQRDVTVEREEINQQARDAGHGEDGAGDFQDLAIGSVGLLFCGALPKFARHSSGLRDSGIVRFPFRRNGYEHDRARRGPRKRKAGG